MRVKQSKECLEYKIKGPKYKKRMEVESEENRRHGTKFSHPTAEINYMNSPEIPKDLALIYASGPRRQELVEKSYSTPAEPDL